MELLRPFLISLLLLLAMAGCKQKHEGHYEEGEEPDMHQEHPPSVAQLKAQLLQDGYQIFDYVDEETGDTVIMQQYYMAFLNRGPNRTDNKAMADSLQALHMAHLGLMYELGYADISGPFADDGDVRGITIYNVPTLQMADSLANLDPMVQAGWLQIEVKPWWAGKGYPLR